MSRVLFDFRPQPLYVHIDQAAIAEIGVTPNQFQQLVTREHLPGMTCQFVEKTKFGDGERDLRVASNDAIGARIDAQRPKGDG